MVETAISLRVLVENADPRARAAQTELFSSHGFDVVSCGGPRELTGGCPLVAGDACSLVDEVDIVFFDLDLDREDESAVFDVLRVTHPELPVVLEIPTSTARRHARRLEGCTVIPPFDAERLLGAFGNGVARTG